MDTIFIVLWCVIMLLFVIDVMRQEIKREDSHSTKI